MLASAPVGGSRTPSEPVPEASRPSSLPIPLSFPISAPLTPILFLAPRRGEAPLLWSRPSLHSSHSALAERQKGMGMRRGSARRGASSSVSSSSLLPAPLRVPLSLPHPLPIPTPCPRYCSSSSCSTSISTASVHVCSTHTQAHPAHPPHPPFWRPGGGRHRSFGAGPPSTPATPPSRSASGG